MLLFSCNLYPLVKYWLEVCWPLKIHGAVVVLYSTYNNSVYTGTVSRLPYR